MNESLASTNSDVSQCHPTNAPEIQTNAQIKKRPSTLSPLAGLIAFSAILVGACTLPTYLLLRTRLMRVDGALTDVLHLTRRAEASAGQHVQFADVVRDVRRVREEIELLRGQVDKVAGDVRDVRSVLLKERVRLAAVETKIDGLSEQMKTQESRVLSALAVEQKRYAKTENEINELRKTANQNADSLSKVSSSLGDIASFIDQTELEHGIPPEQGKESSKRVNALRDSAFGVWQSIYDLHIKSKKQEK